MSMFGERNEDVIIPHTYRIDCKSYRGMNNKIVFYFDVPRNTKILNAIAFKVGRFPDEYTTAKFQFASQIVRKRIQTNILSDINLEISGGLVLCEISIPEINQLILYYNIQ